MYMNIKSSLKSVYQCYFSAVNNAVRVLTFMSSKGKTFFRVFLSILKKSNGQVEAKIFSIQDEVKPILGIKQPKVNKNKSLSFHTYYIK